MDILGLSSDFMDAGLALELCIAHVLSPKVTHQVGVLGLLVLQGRDLIIESPQRSAKVLVVFDLVNKGLKSFRVSQSFTLSHLHRLGRTSELQLDVSDYTVGFAVL